MSRKKNFLVKIKIKIHDLVFGIINQFDFVKTFLIKNPFFVELVSIDPKKTFDINFPLNKDFKFIQIGGHDGISFDFLFYKILERRSQGIILEPSLKYFQELKKNYLGRDGIILLQKAIYSKNDKIPLFEVNEKGLFKLTQFGHGIGSVNKSHLLKYGLDEDEIDSFEVDCITFSILLDQFPEFSTIDYLQIDTEGFDFEILKMIDFSRFQVNFIRYEKENLSKSDQIESERLLKSFGFEIIGDKYDNYCFRNGLDFCLKYSK
ncbi:MAG: FkbM family methyltransferase [Algoriphagus aquaeductus]|uniref:FkbM family methyltransferase n=1 Tax=Algoriphagus aquaeductus TaxID=475299 RepID=UPI00387A4B1D